MTKNIEEKEEKEIEKINGMDIENQNQTSIENELVKNTLERLPTVRTGSVEAEPIEEIPNKFELPIISIGEPIDEGFTNSESSVKEQAPQEKEAPSNKASLEKIPEELEVKNVPQVEERAEDITEQYEPEITKKLKTDIDTNEGVDVESERQEGEQTERKENVGEHIQEELNANSNISNFFNLN